jgi:hypothetical protein
MIETITFKIVVKLRSPKWLLYLERVLSLWLPARWKPYKAVANFKKSKKIIAKSPNKISSG